MPGPLVFQAQPTVSQGLETWPLPRMCWSGHWSVAGQLAQDCVLVAAFGERKEKGASTETLWTLWLGMVTGWAMQFKGGVAQSSVC